jgi:hypothetical protein
MIVFVLFVHKKSVSKRKICIIFIKKLKIKKTPKNKKKNIFSGFLGGWFFFVFLRGFYCQPCPEEEEKDAEDGGRRVRAVRQRVVTAPRPSSPPALQAAQQVAPA